MRINREALRFLSGILRTCMFEKGEAFSKKQVDFLSGVSSEIDLDNFCEIFPLEQETKEKLSALAQSLRKNKVDAETVLSFFGGDLHIKHATEDVVENGLTGILADLFLIFHVVISVKLREDDGKIVGLYSNGDIKFELRGLEIMDPLEFNFDDSNQVALVHYGSVFDSVLSGSPEEQHLLVAQSSSQFFKNTGKKINFLECEKMLKALQVKKRTCHSNSAR